MHPSAEAIGLAPALAVGLALGAWRGSVSRARIAVGALGVCLVFAAFFTQLEPLANHRFLWAHLLQNVVLTEWAPVLLVLAVPPRLAERAAGFPLFRPFVALPVWLAAYYTWHLPWIYDAALRHPHSLLHVEHVTYLVARTAYVGARPARGPADRRRDDGGRRSRRLLRRLRRLPPALPRGRAGRWSAQSERAGSCNSRPPGRPARSSRLRSALALSSAPSSRAMAASHNQVSITITAASVPQVLLYEPKWDV